MGNEVFKGQTKMNIVVGGKKLTLQAEGSPEYIMTLVDYVNNKIKMIEEAYPVLKNDRERLLILVALNIADELYKQVGIQDSDIESFPEVRELKEKIKGIIGQIEDILKR